MNKLSLLSAFLLTTGLFDKDQYFAWVEDPRVIPASDSTSIAGGEPGMVIAYIKYQGMISIERFNHTGLNTEMLIAHLASWLQENDPHYTDDHETQIDTDIEDLNHAEIAITIQFEEAIELTQDDEGPVTFNDKQWSVANAVIHVAEEGEVYRGEGEASEVSDASV